LGGQAQSIAHPSRVKKQMEGAEGVLPQREDEGDPEELGRKDEKGNEATLRRRSNVKMPKDVEEGRPG
jgi:hypothetical protein